MRTILRNGLVLAAVIAAPAVLPAQASSRSHPGIAWVGCWEPIDGLPGSRTTCVAPEGSSALRITAIGTGGSLTESTLQLDGVRHEIEQNDCRGWESARVSKDGDRILIESEIACASLPKQRRAGAFVITPNGDWLHIEGAGISRVNASGVRRFRHTSSYLTVPMQLRDAVTPWLVAAEEARYASMDASLSAKDLIELEEAEVPVPIIDVLVASAHPQAFSLEATSVARRPAYAGTAVASENGRTAMPYYASFGGWPWVGMYDPFLMFGNCGWGFDAFCNARFGMWGSPFGFNGFGAWGSGWGGGWGGGWGWGGIPVTVVPIGRPSPYDPSPSNNAGGRNVRGRGYTQGGDNTSGTATPRNTGGNASSGNSNSGGGSMGGAGGSSAGAGSSSGSSGSTPRTAKPRNP